LIKVDGLMAKNHRPNTVGVDSQGIAWEAFHCLQSIPLFGDDPFIQLESAAACCKPKA
jgi:hypothetical protein